MTKLRKGNIVSCFYNDQTRIVEIVKIRDLTKDPIDGESLSDHHKGSRFLYTVLTYIGEFRSFYDKGMTEVIVLSDDNFINGKLKARFDEFKKYYKKKTEDQTSGCTPEQDCERLGLNNIHQGAKIKVEFYGGKTKTARLVRFTCEDNIGILTVLNPGINVHSKIRTDKIKALYILEEQGNKLPVDPYMGMGMHELFEIPPYEIEYKFTQEFRKAFRAFIGYHEGYPCCDRKYRFILKGGAGFYDKHLVGLQDYDDDMTISISASKEPLLEGKEIRPFSLQNFESIIRLE